jgi:hypothetical protein
MGATLEVVLRAKDFLSKSFSDAALSADGLTAASKKLHTTMGVVGAAAAAMMVGYKVKQAITDSMALADSILEVSKSIGLSTDDAQRWDYVLRQNGSTLSEAQVGFRKLSMEVYSAAMGYGDAGRVFKLLGISVYDTNGNIKASNEILTDTILKLSEVKNATERTALAQQAFGKNFTAVAPILSLTTEEIKRLYGEADTLGQVLSSTTIASLDSTADTIETTQKAIKNMVAELTVSLTPAIMSAAEALNGWIDGISILVGKANEKSLAKTNEELYETTILIENLKKNKFTNEEISGLMMSSGFKTKSVFGYPTKSEIEEFRGGAGAGGAFKMSQISSAELKQAELQKKREELNFSVNRIGKPPPGVAQLIGVPEGEAKSRAGIPTSKSKHSLQVPEGDLFANIADPKYIIENQIKQEEAQKTMLDNTKAYNEALKEIELSTAREIYDEKIARSENAISAQEEVYRLEYDMLVAHQAEQLEAYKQQGLNVEEVQRRFATQRQMMEDRQTRELKQAAKQRYETAKDYGWQSFRTVVDLLEQGAKKNKEMAIVYKTVAISEAIITGAINATKAMKAGLDIGGPWGVAAGIAFASVVAAQTAMQVATISSQKFARGTDSFTTRGPQLIMVGDNSGGRERVSVTPESSPNYDGGGSAPPMVVNFYDNSGTLTDSIRTELRDGRGDQFINELKRRMK